MKMFSATKSVIVKRIDKFFFKKSLISIVLSIVTCQLLLVSPAFAATDPCLPQEGSSFSYGKVVDNFSLCAAKKGGYGSAIFNGDQLYSTADNLLMITTGYSLNHPETNAVTANTGALATMSNGVAMIYAVPPSSGVTYFAEKLHNLNPVQDTYAATNGGLGFNTLQAVEKLWQAFRDIAYIGFIIIFVVIGFMIMFRRKISSQAVATVQDSLPRIIIALILVTFSYAIAGLMLDLMYVVINLIAAILKPAGLQLNAANIYFEHNIFSLIAEPGTWNNLALETSVIVSHTLQTIIRSAVGIGGCSFDFSVSGVLSGIGNCTGGGIVWVLGWIGGIIFGIALIFSIVRIFFMLLMAYVSIILLTIFAPIIFLFQALPGNNGAKAWFKQMIANISVFPTVVLMFMLAGIIAGISSLGGPDAGVFANQTSLFNAPLLTSGFSASTLGSLIGLGIIMMVPTAAKMVKEQLSVKEGVIGAGAGAAFGALAAGAAPFQKAGGSAIAPYKQAFGYERQQKAYETMTGKQMYQPHPAAEPGSPHGSGGR